MLPARRPRLIAQRIDELVSAARTAKEAQVREFAASRAAEAAERDRALKRRASTPLAQTLKMAGGWVLSILGALIVSLLLTWIVGRPQVFDSLANIARSVLRVK